MKKISLSACGVLAFIGLTLTFAGVGIIEKAVHCYGPTIAFAGVAVFGGGLVMARLISPEEFEEEAEEEHHETEGN